MGDVFFKQENYQEAEEMLGKALKIHLDSKSTDHAFIAKVYHLLGVASQVQQKLAEAIKMFKKSLALKLEAFGEVHHEVASSYLEIGGLLQEKKRLEEAEVMIQKALEIESHLERGPQVDLKGRALNYFGALEMDRGNCDKAMEMYQKMLESPLQDGGERLLCTATAYYHISMVHLR
ncbi:unnamed protein product [Cylindrotheca closterium]|uniref:MalT-like TPR region domain-containing protein n=1 Tax=Cylindrotheca closterium TaxID=2856 RepID=A0AAD2C9X5_9STRA|nr:unnamed protein product [Cylindrotheca closterium]